MIQPFNQTAIGSLVPVHGSNGTGVNVCIGTTIGDILYWTGVDWCRLAPGDPGQHLETNGAGAPPSWETTPDGQAFDYFAPSDGLFPTAQPAGTVTRDDELLITFAQLVDSDILFPGAMDEKYDGGTIAVDIYWVAAAAIADDVRWSVEWLRQAGGDAISGAFAAPKTVDSTAPGVNGDIAKATITFTQAEADSVAAGDPYRIRVRREGTNNNDTMTDTAQLLRVTVEEP